MKLKSGMKGWEKLYEQALEQGWRIEPTKKGHLKWMAPNGKDIVVTATSPSDHRALSNTRARLRRFGLHD